MIGWQVFFVYVSHFYSFAEFLGARRSCQQNAVKSNLETIQKLLVLKSYLVLGAISPGLHDFLSSILASLFCLLFTTAAD